MTDPKRTKHSQNITFNEKSAILEFFYKALQNFQSPVADLFSQSSKTIYICKHFCDGQAAFVLISKNVGVRARTLC